MSRPDLCPAPAPHCMRFGIHIKAAGLPAAPADDQNRTFIYYHGDHLGSSNIVTDRNGEIVQQIEYTPYGEIRHETNLGVSVNRLYTGQELDRETGLYYYNARYYDSKIGRFISPDTLIPDASNSQQFNRYSYVLNNPVNGGQRAARSRVILSLLSGKSFHRELVGDWNWAGVGAPGIGLGRTVYG